MFLSEPSNVTNSKKLIAPNFRCFYIRAWLRMHGSIVLLVIMRAGRDASSIAGSTGGRRRPTPSRSDIMAAKKARKAAKKGGAKKAAKKGGRKAAKKTTKKKAAKKRR